MKNSVDPTLAEDMAGATSEGKIGILFDYMVRKGQSFYDESVTQLETRAPMRQPGANQ